MATVTTRIDIPDSTPDYTVERAPLMLGHNDFATVTQKICRVTEEKPPLAWWVAFLIAFSIMGMFFTLIGALVLSGIGLLGNNQPVAWGFPIVNFVFWVGIGHAGTLISAILYLFRQKWRTSINRFAEAMTIFAVICALIWPGIHTGRQWLSAYWLFPYPNQMAMWPQFRSPLLWDVFAVGTYFTVSLLFWYLGLLPDLATIRDQAQGKWARRIYGALAMGWRGSARHWKRYQMAYLLLAGLATPLVV